MSKSIIKKFLSKIKISKRGCWEWIGGCNDAGYGKISINYKNTRAHRFMYEYYYGSLNPNLMINHLCENRKCVNPSHLEETTLQGNFEYSAQIHGYHKSNLTICPSGHPYSGDNLYVSPKGFRECRICRKLNNSNWRKKFRNFTFIDQIGDKS